jgi:hypothetical protein
MSIIEAADTAESSRDKALLDWARAESKRSGLRPLAKILGTDAANLGKVLSGKRGASRVLLESMAQEALKRD